MSVTDKNVRRSEMRKKVFGLVCSYPGQTAKQYLKLAKFLWHDEQLELNNIAPRLTDLNTKYGFLRCENNLNGELVYYAIICEEQYNQAQADWAARNKKEDKEATSHRRIDQEVARATRLMRELFSCRQEVFIPCSQALLKAIYVAKNEDISDKLNSYKNLKETTDSILKKMRVSNKDEYAAILSFFAEYAPEESEELKEAA